MFPLTDSQLFSCIKRMDSDEHLVYRFCTVTVPAVLEIADYESAWAGGQVRDEFPKIKGSWSYLSDTTLSGLLKSFTANVSLVVKNELGMKKQDGTLTGCYRSIRDNESDISLVLTDFPTIDYEKVDPYQIVTEYSLKIMSGYYSKTEADVSFNDFILTSIKSFDSQTWFAVMAMVSAFFGLWMTKRALFPDKNHVLLRRRIAEALWDTLLLFISQESTDYDKLLDRILSIVMTLSFFFLTTIYFGLMSTDLVTVAKPAVIYSYQDIMNRSNIIPIFATVLSDTQEFEDAYADQGDSIQAKFWAKYKDKVEMIDQNGDLGKLIDMMKGGADLNRVVIMNGLFIDGFRRATCRLKIGMQVHENVYTWIAKDVRARMHKNTFIMRNGMKQTPQLVALRRNIRIGFETGLSCGFMYALFRDGQLSTDYISLPSAPHSQVERCISDQIVYADASVDTIVLQNFQFLCALSVLMLLASIIVLLIELYCHRNVQVAI